MLYGAHKQRVGLHTPMVFLAVLVGISACNAVEPSPTPTLSPVPSPNPTITQTPTATATHTATPTPRPTATQSPPPGLNMPREDIQRAYEAIGVSFGAESMGLDGLEVYGENRAELRLIQVFIVGEEQNADQARVFVYLPLSPSRAEFGIAFDFMAMMLDVVFPDWEDGPGWLLDSLQTLEMGAEAKTQRHGITVTLSFLPGIRDELIFWLTVSGP